MKKSELVIIQKLKDRGLGVKDFALIVGRHWNNVYDELKGTSKMQQNTRDLLNKLDISNEIIDKCHADYKAKILSMFGE